MTRYDSLPTSSRALSTAFFPAIQGGVQISVCGYGGTRCVRSGGVLVFVFRPSAVGSNTDMSNRRCRSFAAAQQQHAARSSQPSSCGFGCARVRSKVVRGSTPVRRFWSALIAVTLFRSSLPSCSALVPVALAQESMKGARDMLAIARIGGGTGQLCDAPGAAAPGAWGDARVRPEGGSLRAPTSIDFA